MGAKSATKEFGQRVGQLKVRSSASGKRVGDEEFDAGGNRAESRD